MMGVGERHGHPPMLQRGTFYLNALPARGVLSHCTLAGLNRKLGCGQRSKVRERHGRGKTGIPKALISKFPKGPRVQCGPQTDTGLCIHFLCLTWCQGLHFSACDQLDRFFAALVSVSVKYTENLWNAFPSEGSWGHVELSRAQCMSCNNPQ